MQKTAIPFSPFPIGVLKVFGRLFRGVGARIAKAFPYLELELRQAGIEDVEAEEYGAIMLFMLLFYFIAGTLIVGLLTYKLAPEHMLLLSPSIGGFLAFMVFIQVSMYPKMRTRKKIRDIEQNLIYALRTMLIEIKSGVSLFDAMQTVAVGEYGGVSREIKQTINEINIGTPEEAALQELAMNNPSTFFRRAIWQVVNGLKAGTDVGILLKTLIETLSKEQTIQIRRYGSALRMLSLMYMMLGVIIPALGLAFMIVLGSFPQMNVTELLFWAMLAMLIVAQFMFLGILKAKRPTLVGG